MPELVLIVGLPGAGKTTTAKQLAERTGAVRLTPDDWMAPLFRQSDPGGLRDVLEGRLIWTAVQILRAGASVILDFGLWSRDERAALRWLAGTVGATARTVYLPVDRATQAERVARRWAQTPDQTFAMTAEQLEAWRAQFQEPDTDELDGLCALPDPPAGWEAWIAARWPTARG